MRIIAAALCTGVAALLPAAATEPAGSVPDFSSNGVSWRASLRPKRVRRNRPYLQRLFAPASGLGPSRTIRPHPYINNEWRARPTAADLPVADLNNPNLKPWLWRR